MSGLFLALASRKMFIANHLQSVVLKHDEKEHSI